MATNTINQKLREKYHYFPQHIWDSSFTMETKRGTRRYFIIGEVIANDEENLNKVYETAYSLLFSGRIPNKMDMAWFILQGLDKYVQTLEEFYVLRTVIDCP